MVEQADRAELRKLVDSERQALAEMQASVGEQGADVTKLDAWIKASGKMATAARVHFPALLDELDAADLASLPCKSGEGAGERQAIARIIRGHMPSHWCDEDALRTEAYSTALADAIFDATQTREAEGGGDAATAKARLSIAAVRGRQAGPRDGMDYMLADEPAVSAHADEDEARSDAWSDFAGTHLEDGNGGYRAADVFLACRLAFDAAWPNGSAAARSAALAALSPQTLPAPGEVEDVRKRAQSIWDKRWFCVEGEWTPDEEPIETDEPRRFAEIAIAALTPATVAAANDEGDWVLVPREITQAMLDATCATDADDRAMRAAWSELIRIAPKPLATSRLQNEGASS